MNPLVAQSEAAPVVLFFIVVCLFGAFALYAYLRRQKQREALALYAVSRGLRFAPGDPFGVPSRFGAFELMNRGHSRKASEVLWGSDAGRQVMLFHYQYTTGSGKNQTTHHAACCSWTLPAALAPMALRPEGFFDHVAEWFGQSDINFESEQFSRRYHVTGQDRREVYDVITPRMMEFIMQSGLEHLQVNGPTALVFVEGSSLTPERCQWLLGLAAGFDRNMPEHVVREKRERGAANYGA